MRPGHLLRALLLLAAALLHSAPAPAQSSLWRAGFFPGKPAPDYNGVTLEGDSLRVSRLRGQVVLLNVWATWCPPCEAELPGLQRLHEAYGAKGLRVVGISLDRRGRRSLQQYLQRHRVTYPNVKERESRLLRMFGFQRVVPQTLLIDQNGVIVWYWAGGMGEAREQQVVAVVERLLASPPEPPAPAAPPATGARATGSGQPRGAIIERGVTSG